LTADWERAGLEQTRQRRHEQLTVLAETAAQGAALQPGADAAVSDCGQPGLVPDEVALRLGSISHGYSALYERVRNLRVDAELKETHDELCRVLSYHLHMLRDAGDLAFSGRPDPHTERFRRELAEGLGTYATKLLVLAGECRTELLNAEKGGDKVEIRPTRDEFELDDVELTGDEPEPS
jgi:hypothetical protein